MSIEQRIRKYLDLDYELGLTGRPAHGVEYWKWSEGLMTWADDLVDTEDDMLVLLNMIGISAEQEYHVICMIRDADDVECLSSEVEFIRKAKKWFMEQKKCV